MATLGFLREGSNTNAPIPARNVQYPITLQYAEPLDGFNYVLHCKNGKGEDIRGLSCYLCVQEGDAIDIAIPLHSVEGRTMLNIVSKGQNDKMTFSEL